MRPWAAGIALLCGLVVLHEGLAWGLGQVDALAVSGGQRVVVGLGLIVLVGLRLVLVGLALPVAAAVVSELSGRGAG